MANWLLLSDKDGATRVVGPLHHVGVEDERIFAYDEAEREIGIAQRGRAATAGKWGGSGYTYSRWKTASGFEFDAFDLCDGRSNPWPDFRAVPLSKA
jgi:hypothetical protein